MIDVDRMHDQLRHLADTGRPTPCQDDPVGFTSDDRGERTLAAAACRASCPLLDTCGLYAVAVGAQHHVWAGIDITPSHGHKPGRHQLTARYAADLAQEPA